MTTVITKVTTKTAPKILNAAEYKNKFDKRLARYRLSGRKYFSANNFLDLVVETRSYSMLSQVWRAAIADGRISATGSRVRSDRPGRKGAYTPEYTHAG